MKDGAKKYGIYVPYPTMLLTRLFVDFWSIGEKTKLPVMFYTLTEKSYA